MTAQDCTSSGAIQIVPNATVNLQIDVSGLINNDLETNQSICGVRLVFSHPAIQNIRITLVSPSGQRLELVGPARINSTNTQNSEWNVLFVPCALPASPDNGIDPKWDNDSGWSSFSNFNGVYYPSGNCFEDLNQGSANGTWVIEVDNLGIEEGLLEFVELIFCEPEGSDCEDCFLFAGEFRIDSPGGVFSFCDGDPIINSFQLEFNIQPIIDSESIYRFMVFRNNLIVDILSDINDVANLTIGEYDIVGLAIKQDDEIQLAQINSLNDLQVLIDQNLLCGDMTAQGVRIRILNVGENVEISQQFCENDSVLFRGDFYFEEIDTSVFVLNSTQTECDSLILFSTEKIIIDPVIVALDTTVDCGEAVFLNASTSTSVGEDISDFSWSTLNGTLENSIGPIAQASSGGTYFLTVEAGICQEVDSVLIVEIDTFPFDITVVDPLCEQDSFLIFINSEAEEASLVFGGNDMVIQNSELEYYTFITGDVTIQANLGTCIEEEVFTIPEIDRSIELTITSSIITCENNFSEINFQTNISNPTFNITGPEDLMTSDLDIILGSRGEYTISVIDENGCEKQFSFEIIAEDDVPQYELNDIEIACNETVSPFDLSISTPIDSVIWSGPNLFQSTLLNPIPIDSGEYNVIIFGSNGCQTLATSNFIIQDIQRDIVLDTMPISCLSDNIDACLTIDPPSGENISFWQDDNLLSNGASCISISSPGEYEVQISGPGSCFRSIEFFINDLRESPFVEIEAITENLNCDTDSIELSVNTSIGPLNAEINWFYQGNLTSEGFFISVAEAGEYIVDAIDTTTMCMASDTILINQGENALSNLDFFVEQPLCFEDLGMLIFNTPNSEIENFDILLNEVLIEDISSFDRLEAGFYDLQIINGLFCSLDTFFEIIELSEFSIDLGEDLIARTGEEIVINADFTGDLSQIFSINWNNSALSCGDCLNPTIEVSEEIELIIEIFNENGCLTSDSLFIFVDDEVNYFVPNVFTPNDDGNNDEMSLYLSDGISKVFDLRIFDRWGNLVLFQAEIENSNNTFIWDGTKDGLPVQAGVYVYMAKLLLVNGSERQIFGDITLLR